MVDWSAVNSADGKVGLLVGLWVDEWAGWWVVERAEPWVDPWVDGLAVPWAAWRAVLMAGRTARKAWLLADHSVELWVDL